MENLSRSLEGAGLEHLDFRSVYIDQSSTEEVLDTLDGVRAVACATITAKKLRELGVRKSWRSSRRTAPSTRAASRCSAA